MKQHKNYWLDEAHTQFLYWVHEADSTYRAMILKADVDMPKDMLEAIADDFNKEYLNDRYQEELVDYNFVIKRSNFEKGMSGVSDQTSKTDPYEDLADPAGDIFDVLFPSEVANYVMKEKFSEVLKTLMPQQITLLQDYYLLNKSMQEIADEAAVSHQAITNRMNKVFLRIQKAMPEYGATAPRRKSSK